VADKRSQSGQGLYRPSGRRKGLKTGLPVGLHLGSGDGLVAVRTERNVARTVEAVHPVVGLRDLPPAENEK
jgi:hypothetical protein